MRQISGTDFFNEVVLLDDTHFSDCTLTDCTLSYAGGEVILERTSFHGCRMLFDSGAGRTVQLLQCLGYLRPALDACEVDTCIVH